MKLNEEEQTVNYFHEYSGIWLHRRRNGALRVQIDFKIAHVLQ